MLRSLSPAQQKQILTTLPDDVARSLVYDWGLWARDNQLPPQWDWVIWLILAGRGYGKTRSGAEWVRQKVESGEARRIILAGPTADDLRDVMIEGESGLLAVSSPSCKPEYIANKGKVIWPNGAKALCITAEKPDRFRGKQCFVAGTIVDTSAGACPIESVRVGDLVLTRNGYRRVRSVGSRVAEVGTVCFSNGSSLTGTEDHPVLSCDAWHPLGSLSIGSRIFFGGSARTVSVVSTWARVGDRTVYNLSVEDSPEYFANGILVHNCDAFWADELASWRYPDAWSQLQLGFRLGRKPQGMVTTTPRPTPLIKELLRRGGNDVAVTRGTTYENRANLAPAFFDAIIRQYEGTRLGRQELQAEVLEDNPGALWQRVRIDELRVREAPELKRVVVAIDPAVSSNPKSDETGIVAAGIGGDGHGYVLDDLSGIYQPAQWASRALVALDRYQADRIVGETNNGGDLVEANLRTARNTIPYVGVHASRGKQTRAEPISALYEQGRVHHIGSLGKLEDQMCGWDPAHDSKSPDRVDALVWALSFLMIGKQPQTPTYQKADFDSGDCGYRM